MLRNKFVLHKVLQLCLRYNVACNLPLSDVKYGLFLLLEYFGIAGQKGIGFKSIFRVTDCPEVHSNGFHICFDAREDKMGYILPTWHDNYTDYFNYSPHNGNLLM